MDVARRQRRRQARRPDRPAHGHADDRGRLAALHGRLHGADPRRLPGRRRSSTTRSGTPGDTTADLLPRAARRRRHQPRARLQRRRADRRHRQVGRAARSLGLHRPPSTPRATASCSTRNATTDAGRLYSLAAYLLVSNGKRPDRQRRARAAGQLVGRLRHGPRRTRTGARYLQNGVWRRDFARGIVLVNEPGEPTRTVALRSGPHDLTGATRSSRDARAGRGSRVAP